MNMLSTIVPKSTQMNADDLLGGPRTITVTKVLIGAEAEQPVAIHFEGDNNKPYYACKSMRRVLVTVWGPDAAKYTGRSMTLYRDENVVFGGAKVGGIRISHMSDISEPITMALTATRAQRKPFTVKPLKVADTPKPDVDDFDHEAFVSTVEKVLSLATEAEELNAWWNAETQKDGRKKYALKDAGAAAELRARVAAKIGELSAEGEV